MLEARLLQGSLLKKTVDAIKDLVNEGNFEASAAGIQLQAMDTSHVCLVTLMLRADGFEHYRCDRARTLGISIVNLQKVLKCAGNDDVITLRAQDDGDALTLIFESPNADRISDFDLKLMDIDSEHLGIPETEYSANARMPSSEFSRICRDLSSIGDGVSMSATKEGIKFTTSGDVGTGNITCKHSPGADKPETATYIDVTEPVALSFALRYLNSFAKAAPLAASVKLCMSPDLPILVDYTIEDIGYVRFYLAPKIEDEDEMDVGGGGGGDEDE
ncbi:MAG: PCNA proliferating cell nuclear antigen [Monoraphidium minutum]|nr:MAG: PCNA proliferating cell nuclear antigen [Monoraphidium minutum]